MKLTRVELEMILTWNSLVVNEYGSNDEAEEALVKRLEDERDRMEARGDE